jgi:hypothetical protein
VKALAQFSGWPISFPTLYDVLGMPFQQERAVAEIACDVEDFGYGQGRNRTPDTRIFSPLTVSGLCVTIGRYWYLFKRLTPLPAGQFYRFEHIVAYSSGKVVAK